MSILLSVIVFSTLVLIHEFGHFLLAKKNGIGVNEFAIGMGPKIIGFHKGGTHYCWRLIPFGGACMMVGEDEENDSENSFNSKSVWARIAVVVAGPVFNFILAFVLSIVVIGMEGYDKCIVTNVKEGSGAWESGLREGDVIREFDGKNIVISRDLLLYQYIHDVTKAPIPITYMRDGQEFEVEMPTTERYLMGISYMGTDEPCKITAIVKGSAAEEAGLEIDDVIVSLNGTEINSGKQLSELLDETPLTAEQITFEVKRGDEVKPLQMTPKIAYDTGFNYTTARVKANALETLRYSLTELRYNIDYVFGSFEMLFVGKASVDDVSGPVGIVDIVGDTYKAAKQDGARYVFLNIAFLMVLFSTNLGVLNLLPFPALDGGRLVFLFLEVLRGKPVPREKEAIVHLIGMVALMVLMVLIMVNDIGKLL